MSNPRLLKSGASYIVCMEQFEGETVVTKYANHDNGKIAKEVERIETLRQNYPTMARRMPEILDVGFLAEGIQAGSGYYRQRYVDGATVSSLLSGRAGWAVAPELVDQIEAGLCESVAEMDLVELGGADYERTQKKWLVKELEAILVKPWVGSIASQADIQIDGRTVAGLAATIGKIVDYPWNMRDVDVGWSEVGHWNFHGDNILVGNTSAPEEYSIVDPDSGIYAADPVFSVCRFLYSFPHDTAEYSRYMLESDVFRVPGQAEYRISYSWPDQVASTYSSLFLRWRETLPAALEDAGMGCTRKALERRVAINLLLCLMRGVNANFSQKIVFEGDDMNRFRNSAIFLLLYATGFAAEALSSFVNQGAVQ